MKDSGPSSIGERTGVLIHGTSEDVPPNAILLSPSDVYRLRKSQLWSWNNRSEVWPLIYGPRLAAATVGISSFVANINARQLFNLRGQKFFWSTIMPTLAFPITCYWAAQELLINRPILSRPPQPWNGEGPCDLCLEVRASVLQLFCGFVLPCGLAFLTSSLAAITARTYPVPALSNPKALWSTFKLYNRGFRITGPVMLLVHTLMGSGLTALMLNANRASLSYEKQMGGNVAVHPPMKTD